MESIFTLGDASDTGRDVNMDDLYEYQKTKALEDVALYNRILSRIQSKIRIASRQRNSDQSCWYVIPETLIGIPRYNVHECTAYIIDKLQTNGFIVRYTHPNLLLISWANWVPSYVRSEIKKKTGVIIDGQGNKKSVLENKTTEEEPNMFFSRKPSTNSAPQKSSSEPRKTFRDISSYQPSGSSVYGENLLKAIKIPSRNSK
jgi:hypothetical protein